MSFHYKEPIEIYGKQGNFSTSYYPATLLAAVGKNRYLVRYQTRYKNDKTTLLTEALDAANVRPVPPVIKCSNFQVNDRVDAYINGGWWVGRIVRKDDPSYFVRLDINGNEVDCPFYEVRFHLDWRNGNWFYPGSGPQNDGGQAKEHDQNVSQENEVDQKVRQVKEGGKIGSQAEEGDQNVSQAKEEDQNVSQATEEDQDGCWPNKSVGPKC